MRAQVSISNHYLGLYQEHKSEHTVVFYTVYSIVRLSSVGPSHYVVHFIDDDCIACVPKKVIVTPPDPIVGDACCVQWSDGVEYAATVLAMGKCLLESVFFFKCVYMFTRQALSTFECIRVPVLLQVMQLQQGRQGESFLKT